MRLTRILIGSTVLLAAARPAAAHLHFTVNTYPTGPGAQAGIETYDDDAPDLHGNYSQLPDSSGQLTFIDGSPLTITLETLVGSGQAYPGFIAGEAPTLTTDLYVDNGSGHLVGGDFWYEIHSLAPVAGKGGSASARLVWTIPADADENPTVNPAETATAGASPREARSLDLGYDEHLHGETLYVDQPGLYNVGMIVWDKNGKYLDSPLTKFRVNVPIPGDANLDGKVDFSDLLVLAQHFGMPSGGAWENGDFYNTGQVDFSDLLVLAQHYGQDLGSTAAATALPEPTTVAPAALAAVVIARRRRRA